MLAEDPSAADAVQPEPLVGAGEVGERARAGAQTWAAKSFVSGFWTTRRA